MTWCYGVTTCPARRSDLLPRTLASLAAAGFDSPHLFIDGCDDPALYRHFGLSVTTRAPAVKVAAHWCLTLAELYARDPWADRYAVFQDDLVTYRNLRAYLDATPYPDGGYCNLYTYPYPVQSRPPPGLDRGWYPANQKGKGALALVFDRPAVMDLLASRYLVDRFQSVERGHRSVDGGIVEAMKAVGRSEYVHHPSLVQHTGLVSSMDKRKGRLEGSRPASPYRWGPRTLASTFRGEDFDALEMLACHSAT